MPEAYQDNEVIMEGYKKIKKYVIPNDWDLIKLGDLTTKVGSGKTPKGGEAVYQSSGIPFIRSQNVLDNKLELSNVSFISESVHDEMKSTKVKANDVLLNITGASIGRCCVVPEDFIEGNINQHVCIIRPKANLNEIYLSYVLQSTIGQRQIFMNQAGGNREGLNFEQIRKFDIPFPNLKEQQKIANVLSIWDKAIELKEKLIEQKKEQKKGLMQRLLTGSIRLSGFCEEWNTMYLEEICVNKGLVRGPFGGALKKEYFVPKGYKVYEQKNAIYKDANLGDYYINENKFLELKRFEVKQGDFIVSCSGTIGRIYKIPDDSPKGVINQALLKITIDKKLIDSEYFYQYFQWEHFQNKIIENTQGGAMQNLVGMDIFRKTKIAVPNLLEQNKIASILSILDKEIYLEEQDLIQKEEQKKALMQQLLTGKIRVKV